MVHGLSSLTDTTPESIPLFPTNVVLFGSELILDSETLSDSNLKIRNVPTITMPIPKQKYL